MKLGITKEYHHQKLALERRKVCHTLVYLVTLLHSSNTKDVKEVILSASSVSTNGTSVNSDASRFFVRRLYRTT